MGVMRVVLALSVASAHYNLALPLAGFIPFHGHGGFSVSAFFVISGFYMALVLSGKYATRGLVAFYKGRALRLLPTLWAGLALSAVLAVLSGTTSILYWAVPLANAGASFADAPLWQQLAVISANTTSLGTDALGIANRFDLTLFPPGWSLSVEIMFYALVPLLVGLRTSHLAALALASLALRLGMLAMGSTDYLWQCVFFPNQLVFFIAGMLGFRVYGAVKTWSAAPRIGAAALAAFVAFWLGMDHLGAPTNGLLLGYCLGLAIAMPFIFTAFEKAAWDRALGEWSFALYVMHFPAYKVVGLGGLDPIYAYAATILLAAAAVHFIERPLRRRSGAASTNRRPSGQASPALLQA
jgi:peptidoglycan/LPS O-acetylase OafA/YrhL